MEDCLDTPGASGIALDIVYLLSSVEYGHPTGGSIVANSFSAVQQIPVETKKVYPELN